MIFTRRVFTWTSPLLLLPGLLAAETLVQWGELSGVTPGNTNIVTANQNFIGTSSTYTGATNNPAVGAAYYPEATGRSPWFSAASSVIGARIVEHASSGDRLTMYASTAAGATFRGMYMWVSNYFLAVSQPFVATNVLLVMNQRSNANTTDQSVRVVVQQNDQYFITDGRPFSANASTSSYTLATETWYSFSPFSSGSESIGGAVAAPSLTNVQAIGCYFTTLNGGGAAANTGAQLWHFRVNGTPVASGPVFYTLTAAPQNPAWGSVTPTSGVHAAGSVVAVTATASNYFYFSNWSGGISGVANPTNVTVNDHLAITGVFAERLATNQTPQWWLASFGLTPDDDGALSDLDLDGVPAWQEFQAGTNPTISNAPATAVTRNVRLVDFGAKLGSGFYRGQTAPRTYTALHDEDNNGTLTNDTVRAWLFSTNQALNPPGLEYDTNSPSGVFYGGLSIFAVNNPDRSLSEGLLNQNHEFMDDANMMGLGDIIEGEQFSAYGVWFWQKQDFLNGGDDHVVRFDTNSLIAVHISRYWGGVNAGRWLVRQGGQFYLSQSTFGGKTNQYDLTTTSRPGDPGDGANNPVVRTTHVLHPHTTLWSPYNPGPAPGTNDDFEIGFNPDTATFSALTLTNITAVGFFIERKLSTPQIVASGLLANQPMGVKWNAFQCRAVVDRPATPSYHAPTTPVLGGGAHLASNSVPYELWRRVFRHMVRRQYPRELGALTYALERDGTMGTMRVDAAAHAGTESVREITWLDALAFCNGLSELEGLEPCYYTDPAMTNVLRIVMDRDRIAAWAERPTVYWKTLAGGLRLPTAAEWEDLPPALRDTNSWEYVWHLTGNIADPATHTNRTVRGWGLTAPTNSIGRFAERPWQGSPRIGFRLALNATNLPNPAAAAGAASTWTFHPLTTLAPTSPPSVPALRTEIQTTHTFTNLTIGLVQTSHAADTNFNPAAVITNAPVLLEVGATEIPFHLWNLVQGWARDQGYRFNYDGDMGSMGNAPGATTHTNTEPVTQISLYDALVWCNALSELMGRSPVYHLDAGFTTVYRQANLFRLETLQREGSPNWPNGSVTPYDTAALIPVYMNVTNDGYRLLLPQEWNLANVTNALTPDPAYNWLVGNAGGKTQPAGTLLPNPLGLFDMNGNVLELTWGSTKATLVGGNIPLRQGSHFARNYRRNETKSPDWGEFAGVGRTHVGFRIAARPPSTTASFTLAVLVEEPWRGSVSSTGGTYAAGTTVEVTAAPSNFHYFAAWTGDVTETQNPLSIIMTNHVVARPVFRENRATNGVPHWWLAQHELGTNDSDAVGDLDGDGHAAWQEYIAGTQPTNSQSVLRITNSAQQTQGRLLRWPAATNRVYAVSWSSNLINGAFVPLASGLTEGVFTDQVYGTTGAGFYQIQAEKP
jgi:formylglycine-generating enzyme required for sulfatase activity